jgi:CcmD family protein
MYALLRLAVCVLSVMAFTAPSAAQAQPGQGSYVPVDQLPPADQLPAAPLLIAAYAFVWVAVLFYVWTIWHRMKNVEAEMRMLDQRSIGRREPATRR